MRISDWSSDVCSSDLTYRDNPHLDAEDYRRQLKAACAGDEELFRAWTEGDWSVARGAFFAGCLSPERCAVDPWKAIPPDWESWLAHDFGTSSDRKSTRLNSSH